MMNKRLYARLIKGVGPSACPFIKWNPINITKVKCTRITVSIVSFIFPTNEGILKTIIPNAIKAAPNACAMVKPFASRVIPAPSENSFDAKAAPKPLISKIMPSKRKSNFEFILIDLWLIIFPK